MNRSGQAAAHEDLGGDESREIGFEIKALMSLGCEPGCLAQRMTSRKSLQELRAARGHRPHLNFSNRPNNECLLA